MRQRLGFLAIFLFFVAVGAAGWVAGGAPVVEASAGTTPVEIQTAVFEVEGMTCGGCAAGLEKMLANFDGIQSVKVSYEDGRAYVDLDPAKIQPEQLAAGMSRAGLEATYLPGESGAAVAAAKTTADSGGHRCSPGCTEHDHAALAAAAGHQCPPGCTDHDHGAAAASTASHNEAGCTQHVHRAASDAAPQLTNDQVDRVVTYVIGRLVGGDGAEAAISREEITEATGVAVPDSDLYRVQNEVIGTLREDYPAVLAKFSSNSRCAEYGACSLVGNLAGASGDVLEMYEREKAQDGMRFDDYRLPDFEARDLAGNVVRASDLRGKPAVIVLLAGHCTHCHDSLPILQEAVDTWGPQGVRVVGIVINSGSVEDVNEWLPLTNPSYDVWVDDDESIGEQLGSHLVPSYFFVTADGHITEKLVGYKEKEVVLEKVADLARASRGAGDATATLGRR